MDNSSLGTSFDFNSQAGVMAVLSAIRTSTISSADKNELRDLVFLYTNGGGDPSVRLALEGKLRNLNIVPTTAISAVAVPKEETKKEPEPVVHAFGTSRPAPVFSAPKVTPNIIVSSAPVVPPKETAPIPAKVVPPTPVSATPAQPATSPVVPAASAPREVEPSLVPKPPLPTPAPVVQKTTPVQKEAQGIPSTDADTSRYLDRIREIKATVNGKVGNPVNLVDINNEVGREYMNALLDAMKRLSGGAGQVEPAMARLELSFAAVLEAIDANERSKAIATPAAEPSPTAPAVEMAPEVVAPVIAVEPTPVNQVVPPVVQTPEPKVVADNQATMSPVVPTQGEQKTLSEPLQASEGMAPEVVAAGREHLVVTVLPPTQTPEPASQSGFEAQSTVVQPTPVAPAVSEAPRVLTPEDLPSASSLATSETGDPLFTREVDDGLEQLLSDWILFKKSGLFGTGAKGREHPLFKKIAGLQIPLLLAGRFEGSTQEIKQSITDYMNGWRYEQGIIYEQGETFEHYLRRVIKQILDLQKRRRNT